MLEHGAVMLEHGAVMLEHGVVIMRFTWTRDSIRNTEEQLTCQDNYSPFRVNKKMSLALSLCRGNDS